MTKGKVVAKCKGVNLANLNKKVIKLLVTNDKPAMLKGGIVVNRTN